MENSTGKIRSFIAIELPVDMRNQFRILEEELKNKLNIPASWVKPENCHITLKFLGNITGTNLPQITNALTAVTQDTPPFYLELDAPSAFPGTKHPRILWVGLRGDVPQLLSLHKRVDESLHRVGFIPEHRLFSPHLTLCRIRENLPAAICNDIGNILTAVKIENNVRFKIVELTLFKSQLTPGGPVYTRLITCRM